jgi:dihydropteroate synthase
MPGDTLGVYLIALAEDGIADDLLQAIRATTEAWRRSTFVLHCGSHALEIGRRTLLMGIVNVTPDSFSDGGEFFEPGKAIEHGRRLAAEGADVLDIGGESTRPGAQPVDAEAECDRVLPVVEALAKELDVPISIDTSKATVALRALDAGATMLNDVTALRGDPEMADAAARSRLPLVLMHMQGTPRTMQESPRYDDLMSEIVAYLRGSMAVAVEAGASEEQLVVDPGLGFGKGLGHNLEILRRLGELRSLGRPILIGPSRKSMIGKVLGAAMGQRLLGTAATVAYGIARGAHIVRIHDVAEMRQVARMADALVTGKPESSESEARNPKEIQNPESQ